MDVLTPRTPPALADFEWLETRLIAEFSPPLRPEEVQRCLVASFTRFQSGTVLNYLAILVERDARDELSVLMRTRTS